MKSPPCKHSLARQVSSYDVLNGYNKQVVYWCPTCGSIYLPDTKVVIRPTYNRLSRKQAQ